MQRFSTVDDYIFCHPKWQEELLFLRKMMRDSGLVETVKWGMPVYTFAQKNICGIGAFKHYVGIWFFQGALLADKAGVLFNAQKGKTQAMRQWRFQKNEKFNEKLINAYIIEAIENQKAGRKIKIDRKKPLVIPSLLQKELEASTALQAAFSALTLAQKRNFANYITEAKKAETKQRRLQKIIPMILNGEGLTDKYSNCLG